MSRGPFVRIAVGVAAVLMIATIIYALRGASRYRGRLRPTEYRYGDLGQPKSGAKSGRLPAGLEVTGPEITKRDEKGNAVWSARSPAEFRFDEASRSLTGSNIVWELKRGSQTASIAAKRMEVGVESGEVRFADGITLTAGKARQFALGRARVEPGTWKVVGEGGVRWAWGRFSVTANTLVVDTVNKRICLRGDVHLAQQ